jgi:hypothetical protein
VAVDPDTRHALDLGWRLAALFAETKRPPAADDDGRPRPQLPAVDRLPETDRLELYIRAAASVARRMEACVRADEIESLVDLSHKLREHPDKAEALRARLYECHTTLTKELWARREACGKAFELGTSLFDTWQRVAEASGDDKAEAWKDAFADDRVERIKVLLDDLESRLPSVAVTVVRAHLDQWHKVLCRRPEPDGGRPRDAERWLQSQVATWRQLLTGDKEPESFLTAPDRRRLHRRFSGLIWRSFLRPAPIACTLAIAAVVAALMFGGPAISDAARLVVAPLGAIGLSKASLTVLARDHLRTWTSLLWNRAVAAVLGEVTCYVDRVVPATGGRCTRVRRAAASVTQRLPVPTVYAPESIPALEL